MLLVFGALLTIAVGAYTKLQRWETHAFQNRSSGDSSTLLDPYWVSIIAHFDEHSAEVTECLTSPQTKESADNKAGI